MDILNLENAPLSDRNGSYGGAAGSKEGILIEDQYWLVKYPKSTRSMERNLTSYTTAPLSEYIGSHIYSILGYPSHETVLGMRNGKIVVACKDFCEYPGELREMRTLKNTYNKMLEEMLEKEMSSTGDEHSVELKEILLQLDYNPILSHIPGLKERFWDMMFVDGLVNNNDRNDGNWGLLYRNGAFQIAPVFDNGAAFSNKASEKALASRLCNPQRMEASALNTISVYAQDGKNYTLRKLLQECMQYADFRAAVRRNVEMIQTKMQVIRDFIEHIPESCQGIPVCSTVRKSVYIQDMQLRFDKLLFPALERTIEMEEEQLSTRECQRMHESKEKKYKEKMYER